MELNSTSAMDSSKDQKTPWVGRVWKNGYAHCHHFKSRSQSQSKKPILRSHFRSRGPRSKDFFGINHQGLFNRGPHRKTNGGGRQFSSQENCRDKIWMLSSWCVFSRRCDPSLSLASHKKWRSHRLILKIHLVWLRLQAVFKILLIPCYPDT